MVQPMQILRTSKILWRETVRWTCKQRLASWNPHNTSAYCVQLNKEMCTALINVPSFSSFTNNNLLNISFSMYLLHSRSYAKKKTKDPTGKSKGPQPKAILKDEELMEVIQVDVMKHQMQQVVEKLHDDYIQHVTVRSTAGSIENVQVNIEGSIYPLNQVAQIARKNPQLVVINMSSFPEAIKSVLQGIVDSGMNLNPQQEGTMIYLPIPKVTREHREKLAKNAKALLNKAKEDMRIIQNKYISLAKKHKSEFSEDLIYDVQEQVKLIANEYVAEGEKMMNAKQKELLGDQ
ncbi:ribosome-recycling factor, mitochondrial-like [Limulus polyphemus]|uniref:Ribosome-recycling factor, mitochondrial n=1 Tax=Limulus polyphemus TaxID=6850 RepID=A0ABM1B475_LIMPO|nr:ribosome-recycling factor, mitochondrial-like [Limulus polyphemus]